MNTLYILVDKTNPSYKAFSKIFQISIIILPILTGNYSLIHQNNIVQRMNIILTKL